MVLFFTYVVSPQMISRERPFKPLWIFFLFLVTWMTRQRLHVMSMTKNTQYTKRCCGTPVWGYIHILTLQTLFNTQWCIAIWYNDSILMRQTYLMIKHQMIVTLNDKRTQWKVKVVGQQLFLIFLSECNSVCAWYVRRVTSSVGIWYIRRVTYTVALWYARHVT